MFIWIITQKVQLNYIWFFFKKPVCSLRCEKERESQVNQVFRNYVGFLQITKVKTYQIVAEIWKSRLNADFIFFPPSLISRRVIFFCLILFLSWYGTLVHSCQNMTADNFMKVTWTKFYYCMTMPLAKDAQLKLAVKDTGSTPVASCTRRAWVHQSLCSLSDSWQQIREVTCISHCIKLK